MPKSAPVESVEAEPVTKADPSPPPEVNWHDYVLTVGIPRVSFPVSSASINGKYCRVQSLGGGYNAIEVEGLEPVTSDEPTAVCLLMAEKSAWAGRPVRRFVASDGSETYR